MKVGRAKYCEIQQRSEHGTFVRGHKEAGNDGAVSRKFIQ